MSRWSEGRRMPTSTRCCDRAACKTGRAGFTGAFPKACLIRSSFRSPNLTTQRQEDLDKCSDHKINLQSGLPLAKQVVLGPHSRSRVLLGVSTAFAYGPLSHGPSAAPGLCYPGLMPLLDWL